MSNKKTLLVVGGGNDSILGIQIAKKMDLFVVVSDINEGAPGFEFADDRIIASTYDIDDTVNRVLEYNKTKKINGVITIGADVPQTVSAVAKALSLPSLSCETAKLVTNKFLMKEKFLSDGVDIPYFKIIENLEELKFVINQKGYPLVLKPVDSRGSRGVLKLTECVNLDWAYNYSLSFSPSKTLIVEEFIEGQQISTESVVYKGKIHTLGFADRNYEFLEKYSPHIIENGGEMPSRLTKLQKNQVCDLIERSVFSLGIQNGIAKGDVVYSPDGPKIIEIAGRLSGGYFCYPEIYLATGVNIVEAAIRIALGAPVDENDLLPKYERAFAQRFIFPDRNGRVNEINIPSKILDLEYLELLKINVEIGDYINNVTDHTKRLGVVIVTGKNRSEAIKRAEEIVDNINIKIA
jgi:biotin carboxylase